MNKSYARFVDHSQSPVTDFFADRVIKLFPQYILVVIATFACIYLFGPSNVVPLLNQEISVNKVAANIFLLPANYVFPPLSLGVMEPHPIVPPAWSLATEFHFYLLLPAIFFLNARPFYVLLVMTMGIQFSSFFFASGWFNSENFGYRYIFGVLTVFLYGMCFSRSEDRAFKTMALLVWLCFAVFLFVVSPALNIWQNKWVQEILVGGFVALPLGYYFTSVNVESLRLKRVDNFLGNLAYPMFITHFLAFYLVDRVLLVDAANRVSFYISSILVCLLMSYLLEVFPV